MEFRSSYRRPLTTATSSSAPLHHRFLKLWRPDWYQNGPKRRGYFEGWYFKCVDADAHHAVALIPGISLTCSGAAGWSST